MTNFKLKFISFFILLLLGNTGLAQVSINQFYLIDQNTNQILTQLSSKSTINLNNFPNTSNFAIIVDATISTGAVGFRLNERYLYNVDVRPPFTLLGFTNNSFSSGQSYIIGAKAYEFPNLTGSRSNWSTLYNIRFINREVVDTNKKKGVIMSFDDQRNVNGWAEAKNLLLSLGIKATFFLDQTNRLTPEQIANVWQLSREGHAFGGHSRGHIDINRYFPLGLDPGYSLSSYQKAQFYILEQVKPNLEDLNRLGINNRLFSLPFGISSPDLVEGLRNYVDRVRKTGTSARSNCNEFELGAFNIDSQSPTLSTILKSTLTLTAFNKQNLVLYGHTICKEGEVGNCVSRDYLRQIATWVRENGLEFVRMDEICR
jgi:Polysaccharide deacetylase